MGNIKLFKKPYIWAAIIVSGVLFGIAHLPAYMSFGIPSLYPALILVILNLGMGCVFGRLFYLYGLETAIIAHMCVHILWYPLDICSKI